MAVVKREVTKRFNNYEPPAYAFKVKDGDGEGSIRIKYGFSDTSVRDNRVGKHKYGKANTTYNELFNELIGINLGDDFIEEYFTNVFPHQAQERIDEMLYELTHTLRNNVLENRELFKIHETKSGSLDRRYRSTKIIESGALTLAELMQKSKEYSKSLKKYNKVFFNRISDFIKRDIIFNLRTGSIGLNLTGLSQKTIEARSRAGLPAEGPIFYATGRFIKNLKIYFGVGVSF